MLYKFMAWFKFKFRFRLTEYLLETAKNAIMSLAVILLDIVFVNIKVNQSL